VSINSTPGAGGDRLPKSGKKLAQDDDGGDDVKEGTGCQRGEGKVWKEVGRRPSGQAIEEA
jgi:hypothetical protein